MEPCEACEALDGESAAADPHAAMNGGAVHVRSDGVLERYACCDCGTLWERFRSRSAAERQLHAWLILGARPVGRAAPSLGHTAPRA
jgi:hypothetical protein